VEQRPPRDRRLRRAGDVAGVLRGTRVPRSEKAAAARGRLDGAVSQLALNLALLLLERKRIELARDVQTAFQRR